MTTIPTELRTPPVPPRGVAISGIIFSVLFTAGLVLIRLAVPADPIDPGEWIAVASLRAMVRLGLNLVPFAGIAFLWFIAALRNRVGLMEDRFLATVFLGSGLLFVAMLFTATAVSSSMLESVVEGRMSARSDTYVVARRLSYILINTFGIKMAAVFTFVTSTIGLRTAFLPRWLAFSGFAVGLTLLAVITDFAWIALLFPFWVFLVSAYLLVTEYHQQVSSSRHVSSSGEDIP
ncbi:MAG: hypothetical protein JSS49_20985 [Planctomycetes bacterium]|nr:hypothetical protein [Planctomycetota bacterium]